jgi:hypothetical protein
MPLGKSNYRRLLRRLPRINRLNRLNRLLSKASGVEALGVEACAKGIFASFAKEKLLKGFTRSAVNQSSATKL